MLIFSVCLFLEKCHKEAIRYVSKRQRPERGTQWDLVVSFKLPIFSFLWLPLRAFPYKNWGAQRGWPALQPFRCSNKTFSLLPLVFLHAYKILSLYSSFYFRSVFWLSLPILLLLGHQFGYYFHCKKNIMGNNIWGFLKIWSSTLRILPILSSSLSIFMGYHWAGRTHGIPSGPHIPFKCIQWMTLMMGLGMASPLGETQLREMLSVSPSPSKSD